MAPRKRGHLGPTRSTSAGGSPTGYELSASGSTGRTTGPALLFAVTRGGAPADLAELFPARVPAAASGPSGRR